MAQQGIWPMVPDNITGANTTDFARYLGATKGGKDGHAGYVLCFNAHASSVAAGVAVSTTQASASSSFEPWIVVSTSGAGVVGRGLWANSVAPNGIGWVQTAGLVTINIASTNGTYQAYGNAWAQTNTNATYTTAALSQVLTVPTGTFSVSNTFGVGPLDVKFIVNARFVAASATTAVGLLQNLVVNSLTTGS